MSDEPEVTPLRLKRPGSGGTPPPSAPPASIPPSPATPPAAPESPLMPLPGLPLAPASSASTESAHAPRRRPSLAPEAAVNQAAAEPVIAPVAADPSPVVPLPFAPAAQAVPPPPAPLPPAPVSPAPAAGGAGFKLKMGVRPPPPPAAPPVEEPVVVPPSPPVAAFSSPPEAPLVPLPGLPPAPPNMGEHGAGLPPVSDAPLPPLAPLPVMTAGVPLAGEGARAPMHIRTDAPAEALDPSKLPPPLPPSRLRPTPAKHARRDMLVFGLAILLVLGLGAGAYVYFTKPELVQATATEARAKIEQAAEKAAQIPKKAVDDAKQAIADARVKEQARIDAFPEGKELPDSRAIGVSPAELAEKLKGKTPAAPVPPPPPAETTKVTAYAPTGPEAAPAAVANRPAPSARFLRYAEGLRVSGVFQGNPARALVDGRLVREGDVIEPNLGVTFVDVDAATKHLVLQEGTGAQVRVKY